MKFTSRIKQLAMTILSTLIILAGVAVTIIFVNLWEPLVSPLSGFRFSLQCFCHLNNLDFIHYQTKKLHVIRPRHSQLPSSMLSSQCLPRPSPALKRIHPMDRCKHLSTSKLLSFDGSPQVRICCFRRINTTAFHDV